VSNKVHKFAVIRNEPRELDVIDEAKAERAMQTIVPQFYPTGDPSPTTAKKSGANLAFWQRFARVMRNAPMAREVDPVERTFLKEEPELRSRKKS
jgi:hypothetical protein